jgi:pyruvate/2-oxoglutarate dehydrogenase complex dihydrolipoamide acyltransferase (E2) component
MKTVSGITVDHVFAGYIPALSSEERQQLEANIIEHGGARDPLVVWRSGDADTLIDGHNRYEICTRLGLPYEVEPLEFGTRDEAADWIDRNQLGRRNLSKQDYKLLLGRRYNRAKKAAHSRPGNDNASKNPAEKVTAEKTADRIAKEHGTTEKTVRNAGKFQESAAKLGIEVEIAAGKVKATEAAVVKAAKALPDAPTEDDIEQAVKAVRESPAKKRRAKGTVPAREKFRDLPPTGCLSAIQFYGQEFLTKAPKRAMELEEVLVPLLASAVGCDGMDVVDALKGVRQS